MTVVFATRCDARQKPGGDGAHLARLIDAARAGGWNTITAPPPDAAGVALPAGTTLLHLFNLRRPADLLPWADAAHARGVPVVVSALWHPLDEYMRRGRRGPARWLWRLAGEEGYERRRGAHLFRCGRLSAAAWRALRARGFEGCCRALLERAALVLCTSAWERALLAARFDPPPGRLRVLPLPPAAEFFAARAEPFREATGIADDFVLVTGRVEDLKDPRGILDALWDLPAPLVFIGEDNPAHGRYARAFARRLARRPGAWRFRRLPRPLYVSAFAAARVHVHAAWTESLGLATLEAAAAGAAVVAPDFSRAGPVESPLCEYLGSAECGARSAECHFDTLDGPATGRQAWRNLDPPRHEISPSVQRLAALNVGRNDKRGERLAGRLALPLSPQPSALGPQPSALGPQPSALGPHSEPDVPRIFFARPGDGAALRGAVEAAWAAGRAALPPAALWRLHEQLPAALAACYDAARAGAAREGAHV